MPDRIVRGLNGPRGSGLIAGAVLATAHSVAYLNPGPRHALPSGLSALDDVVPLSVYATAWATAAAIAGWGAFRNRRGAQRDHADAWGHGLVAGLLYLWGGTYLAGWALAAMQHEPSRQWIVGTLYVCVGMLVSTAARMTNPSLGEDT
jgi:hypothetical protein